jgi:hypothetical protein
LVGFTGRLPGFYFVFVDDLDDKAIPRSQRPRQVLFTTDVTINFAATPPVITGTVTEVDGDQQFTLDELFTEITLNTPEITEVDSSGQRDVRLGLTAQGQEGERLDYSLVLHTRLSENGNALEADIEIERAFTEPGQEPIVAEGEGELTDVTKQVGDQTPTSGGNENTADEQSNDNAANENADEANENTDDETPDESANENTEDEPPADEVTNPVSCITDLSVLPTDLIDDVTVLLNAGKEEFDLDDDGIVTATEVQQRIADAIADTGFLFPIVIPVENAECIAQALNDS